MVIVDCLSLFWCSATVHAVSRFSAKGVGFGEREFTLGTFWAAIEALSPRGLFSLFFPEFELLRINNVRAWHSAALCVDRFPFLRVVVRPGFEAEESISSHARFFVRSSSTACSKPVEA